MAQAGAVPRAHEPVADDRSGRRENHLSTPESQRFGTVAIVGVGLIGGSFALGLRKHGFSGRILGVSSARTITRALELGAIDEGLSLEQAAPQADLIYLAQPIGRILEQLPAVARMAKPAALVTDAGSTKVAIVASAQACFQPGKALFLGGHPMAGKAERGVDAADPDLFQGATYVLTPPGGTLAPDDRIQSFLDWITRLGAQPLPICAEDHDCLVAITSHLPQLTATALASLLVEQLPSPDSWHVSGGGLRDTTRLAASSYDLWRDICLTNTENIRQALSGLIQKLEHIRENLCNRALEQEFKQGGRLAEKLQKRS